jgi:hypothetical protein
MDNVYVSLKEALNNMDNGGLLVGNNLEWAREAVQKASAVNISRYIEGAFLLDILDKLHHRAESFSQVGGAREVAIGIEEAISYIAKAVYDKTGNTDFVF